MVEAAYACYFHLATGPGTRLFRGIYPDFASAQAAIPAWRNSGYDNEASAGRNVDEWLVVFPSDYAIMERLSKLLPNCKLLFDWGGNVGLKYFAYRKHLTYPASLRWLVADVPAVIELGRTIAQREGAADLRFTSTLEELPGADVMLAAGSLHFIEDPFGQLRALPKLPEHLILSKVPAHSAAPAWTLNNMGTAMCPYRLFNRDELVRTIEELGFRLVDEWQDSDLFCNVPFFPEYKIERYSGFHFVRDESAGPRMPTFGDCPAKSMPVV
jgi:putative methyltransferase (TIGR04325 family)